MVRQIGLGIWGARQTKGPPREINAVRSPIRPGQILFGCGGVQILSQCLILNGPPRDPLPNLKRKGSEFIKYKLERNSKGVRVCFCDLFGSIAVFDFEIRNV